MSQESTGSIILFPRQVATGDPTGNALENINTHVLGDGALCYVESGAGQGLWQLQKASTDTPDGTTIVAPTAGPGRWFIKNFPGAAIPPSVPLPLVQRVDLGSAIPNAPSTRAMITYPPSLTILAGATDLCGFSLDAPIAPPGYVARATDFRIQLGGPTTGGAPGNVRVGFGLLQMPLPDGVINGSPAVEVLTSYEIPVLTFAELDYMANYTIADAVLESGTALPVAPNPDRQLIMYFTLRNLWAAQIWVTLIEIEWDFVAV